MLSVIFVILTLALVMFLVFKKVNIVIASIIQCSRQDSFVSAAGTVDRMIVQEEETGSAGCGK